MQLTFASYNIHKAVGLDRRRDPERIVAVLREIDADVIALQEADRRIGNRESVLPRQLLEDYSPWRAVPLGHRPDSLGWHGNALLVRRGIAVAEAGIVPLPTLEPRGAVRADLVVAGQRIRVVGMHLDLSGLRRRQQVRAVLAHLARCAVPCPVVVMGDCNEWGVRHASGGGALGEFHAPWRLLDCGRSFPSRRPVARLDRIVVSPGWQVVEAGVHHSALAARGSDHLPVFARLELPEI
ncbi:endonuclease/exonuclease/phosphatase family protein [Novosphingobium sp. B 225]|uniref:endonuclease/exonuclease/phosphatase family protein n=1 Tax=Novosphingobium sp. B 225 TaxID=1961849 RepID=UPI000B4BBBF2|nr:endonuclease/exonuclease/phosphatase family protein [Novosphingobium sp. B 225]